MCHFPELANWPGFSWVLQSSPGKEGMEKSSREKRRGKSKRNSGQWLLLLLAPQVRFPGCLQPLRWAGRRSAETVSGPLSFSVPAKLCYLFAFTFQWLLIHGNRWGERERKAQQLRCGLEDSENDTLSPVVEWWRDWTLQSECLATGRCLLVWSEVSSRFSVV